MIRTNYISLIAFSVSIGVHAVAFIQLGETSAEGRAQAPKVSTRISLSLQKEPEKVVVVEEVKPQPVKKKKTRKKSLKKLNNILLYSNSRPWQKKRPKKLIAIKAS